MRYETDPETAAAFGNYLHGRREESSNEIAGELVHLADICALIQKIPPGTPRDAALDYLVTRYQAT